MEPGHRRDVQRPELFTFAKAAPRGPLPLPLPPLRTECQDKPVALGAVPNDRRGHGIESKLNTLRDYRRARGLCIHCGDKWSRDHKCSEIVQLHVLQEFWDICHLDDCLDSATVQDDDAPQCAAISMAASGSTRPAHAI